MNKSLQSISLTTNVTNVANKTATFTECVNRLSFTWKGRRSESKNEWNSTFQNNCLLISISESASMKLWVVVSYPSYVNRSCNQHIAPGPAQHFFSYTHTRNKKNSNRKMILKILLLFFICQ
jgi:hypothetical protein